VEFSLGRLAYEIYSLAILAQIYQILLIWRRHAGLLRETVNLYFERYFLNLPSLFLILLGQILLGKPLKRFIGFWALQT
jgi:hypothetical protein